MERERQQNDSFVNGQARSPPGSPSCVHRTASPSEPLLNYMPATLLLYASDPLVNYMPATLSLTY